ncbi:MAG: MFS transporter [Deltaproteobacteria bacterium]|nr:MFS transporter [Candidatus Tharpella aukensis]
MRRIQYRWLVLLMFAISQLVLSIAGYGWGALAPFLKKLMSLSNTQIGSICSAFYLTAAFSALPSGILVDRYGVKKGLLAWLGLTGAPLLLLAVFKPGFSVFIMMVAISGFGYGIGNPVCSKGLFLWFDIKIRGLVFGIRLAGVTIGASLSGIVMIYLAKQTGIFNSLGILGLVIAIMTIVVMIYYNNPIQSKPVFNKTLAHESGTFFAEFYKFLAKKNFLFLSVIGACLGMSQGIVGSFIVLYSNEHLGCSLLESGFMLTIVMLSGATGRIMWGLASDRLFNARRKPVLMIISTLAIVSVVTLGVWDVSWHRWMLTSLLIGLGLSTAGWNSIVLTWVTEITAESKTATAIGLISTIGWIGVASGPIIFGSITDHFGFFYAWMYLAFFCILALSLCFFLPDTNNKNIPELNQNIS